MRFASRSSQIRIHCGRRKWSAAISGSCAVFLAAGAVFGRVADVAPVAWWTFDDDPDGAVLDSARTPAISDPIAGYFRHTDGARGKCLRLDGYTTEIVRRAAGVPPLSDAITVEAWVALQTYPWNWTPILNQPNEKRSAPRLFFGFDAYGHLALKLELEGKLCACVSTDAIPLLKWNHVAGTFDQENGLRLFINGKPAGAFAANGRLSAGGGDLVLGKNFQRMGAVNSVNQPSADWPSVMVLDGLLDEVKIYDRALAAGIIARDKAATRPANGQPLHWQTMPSGPKELPNRFAAVYCRLRYDDLWEEPWPVSDRADVLVHFEDSPVRFIFWRGTSYGGAWVAENGRWMGDQSLERAGPGKSPLGCAEHMSDKQTRYSRVSIIEQNDARIVLYWRYAVCDINYDIYAAKSAADWGEWADEYYVIYPDGVSVRHQKLYTDYLSHEWQETIVLNQPGTRPEDNIALNAMSFANIHGESKTYSWATPPPAAKPPFPAPADITIQLVNLKSQFKPFIIHEPGAIIKPYSSGINPVYSHFPWWNHWPVAQLPNDGRRCLAPDRPSHSSLSQSNKKIPGDTNEFKAIHRTSKNTYEVVTLAGMTSQPVTGLVTLDRSWNHPPTISGLSAGFTGGHYDKFQRAYVIERENRAENGALEFTVSASDASPLCNPAFVIRNWGDADAGLTLDGHAQPAGNNVRFGHEYRLDGTDLIVWLRFESKKPVNISLKPVALTASLKINSGTYTPKPAPAGKLRLPSGSPGEAGFGAYSTRLNYDPSWDKPWRIGKDADTVVRFDQSDTRLVFWRGTSYLPCWASENGAWFSDGCFELKNARTGEMLTPLADAMTRYSHVRIIENSHARAVVHWRYALNDANYKLSVTNEMDRGDWIDEFYTIYPDSVSVRKATIHSSAPSAGIRSQQSMVINQPGASPDDGLNTDALVFANLDGETRTFDVDTADKTPFTPPPGACIQLVNLKSKLKPFTIFNPAKAEVTVEQNYTVGARFDFLEGWPASSIGAVKSPKTRPSHTILSHLQWQPAAKDENSITWVQLDGMTDQSAAKLSLLARSWLTAPKLEITGGPFVNEGYDASERAYQLRNQHADQASDLELNLAASAEKPVANLCLVIHNWGDAPVRLQLNGKEVAQGRDFRFGHRDTLEGRDLIVWIQTESADALKLSLLPATQPD